VAPGVLLQRDQDYAKQASAGQRAASQWCQPEPFRLLMTALLMFRLFVPLLPFLPCFGLLCSLPSSGMYEMREENCRQKSCYAAEGVQR
jgi:hypothetical protein